LHPKRSNTLPPPSWIGWLWPLVFAATLLVYLPALQGGLLWDDNGHLTKPALQSLRGLGRIWFELGATQQYYPVLHSAFWLEHRLWGDATLGYHLVNVCFHASSACLLAVLLRRLFGSGLRGFEWLAALLFALHPVSVESVAWISEQKNTLSTLFYLLAALAYLRFDSGRNWRYYGAATALFILAVLSKTVAATLPAALLVIAWWKRGSLCGRRDVLPLVPWLAFGAAAGALTAWVEHRFIGLQSADFNLDPLQRCLLAGRVVWFYLGKLFWPADLLFMYPRWRVNAGAPAQYLYFLSAAALLALLWALRRRSRGPVAALLFFVGSLFPALGFVAVYPFRYSLVADHFQYLASLGIFALVAAGWARWAGRARLPALAAAAALLCVLGVLTWRQSRMYADSDTLYRTTLAGNPDCWMADNNLGNSLLAAGRAQEAAGHFESAVRSAAAFGLKTDLAEAYNNLGGALFKEGRIADAADRYELAVRTWPAYPDAHYNLGNLRSHQGRLPEAVAELEQAVRLEPTNPDFHNNLGNALVAVGQPDAAVAQYQAALRADPNVATTRLNFGTVLIFLGRAPEAVQQYQAAVRLLPDSALAQYRLGSALVAAGRFAEAEQPLQRSLALQPEANAQARGDLGYCLLEEGRLPAAIGQLQEAVRLEPGNTDARNNLGAALARSGRHAEAAVQFQEVLRLEPLSASAHANLGGAWLLLGRRSDALREYRAALRLDPNSEDARLGLAQLGATP
jgi:tetratricopeptide (TPR) repeat protein